MFSHGVYAGHKDAWSRSQCPAAAASKSLQSCLTLCRPHRRQPTRLLCPWDSPGKNTGVGCHFLLQCVKVKSLSRVQLLATPSWTAAYQAPPSMGVFRQEYWSGVPLLINNKDFCENLDSGNNFLEVLCFLKCTILIDVKSE